MIDGLKPYPKMKDSGVPWLAEMPEHWLAASLQRHCRIFSGATPSRQHPEYWHGGTIPWLASGDVNLRRITSARQFITEAGFEASSTKWIEPASLVLALAGQGRTKGMIATVELRATCNQSLAVIEPSKCISNFRFLAYYLECRYLDLRSLVGDDVRDGLNLDHVRSIVAPFPPLTEQAAIVRFLDHADRRIRCYIGAKQKLIKLLEEQKQAIIHRLVTRGLDPNVRLKPSGVEWLGDVPEHWEIRQIAHISRVGNGSTPSRSNPAYWSGGHYPWLNSANANRESIAEADQFVTEVALRECHLPIVAAGSVLVAITGQGKTRGKAAVLRFEATINQHLAYITPRRDIVSADYLQTVLHAAYASLRAISDDSGSTKGALTCTALKHFKVALPAIDEQSTTLRTLKTETMACSGAIVRTESQIALVREYRTRLIADVVTGRLDVRDVVARLPDVASERQQSPGLQSLGEIHDLTEDMIDEGETEIAAEIDE